MATAAAPRVAGSRARAAAAPGRGAGRRHRAYRVAPRAAATPGAGGKGEGGGRGPEGDNDILGGMRDILGGGNTGNNAINELGEPSDWLSDKELIEFRGGTQYTPPPSDVPNEDETTENREVTFFAGLIIAVPLLFSTVMRETLYHPLMLRRLRVDETAFALTPEQKREAVDELLMEEKGRQFDVIAGRAPPVSESPDRLRNELLELEKHEREINLRSVENLISDTTWFFSSSLLLALNRSGVRRLTTGIQNKFYGLEPAAQAFTLLLCADITVGYHSSDGWITIVNGICGHYGWEESETFVSLFVATVPVTIDVLFKYWVFKYLRQMSPTTGIILEDIDRH
eukprot:PRCOL_00003075-RA